jgi:regulator of protease activity HflC (stomatin/prohibitin superfamily)
MIFDQSTTIAAVALGMFTIIAIAALVSTFFTVEQRTAAIVQRLGKFVREAGPGLNTKIPFVDRIVGRINLRVQQLDVKIETKTEDNVFVQMVVSVQYYVLPEKVYDAFYKLDKDLPASAHHASIALSPPFEALSMQREGERGDGKIVQSGPAHDQ